MSVRFLKCSAMALAVAAAACTASIADPGTEGVNGNPSPGTGTGNSGSTGVPPVGTGGTPSTGGGGGAVGGDATVDPTKGQINLNGTPQYYRVVRLTNEQWTNSVQGALALSSPPTAAANFQNAVSGTTDFTNNELVLDVDGRGWSDYQAAAESLAAQVTGDAALLSKLYSGTDSAAFISTVGRRVYRRPLTTEESAAYKKLFDLGATLSGTQSTFAKGAKVVLEAMLQSPYFLYRTELGAAGAPLNTYEMAAKLSLWLRNSAPDDALLDSAAMPGKLDTAQGVAEIAEKMLGEPAAKKVMRQFHGEFLHFSRFSTLSKVGVDNYDPEINSDLAEASYLFFDRIFSQGLGLKDVFLSTTGFVSAKMASLYGNGMMAPASGFAERDLGTSRLGYFMQLPFLVVYSHNAQPDSIHRGVSISLDVLCAPLGPPAGVIPPLPPAVPGQTNRMRVDAHTKGCGLACHNEMINPLGFAFENFDGMGQYRETEKSGDEVLPIDASGAFTFVEGKKMFQNASDLMQVLATDQQAHLCYAKKLAGFGLQRDMTPEDGPLLDALAATSKSATGSVKQVMLDLVKQDAFRNRAGGAK